VYKVGDFIKIQNDIKPGSNRVSGVYCSPEMLKFSGVTARITKINIWRDGITVYYTCKTGQWGWADDMIEGVVI
jgi:hypothetical protein